MEEKIAARALSCLGNEVRLRIFRRLMSRGADGDMAGRLARVIGIPASTMSFHLAQMEEAGLVFSWRVSRSVRYAVDLWRTRSLLVFLAEECCHGNPQICGDLVDVSGISNPICGEARMAQEKIYNVLFLCTGNSARSIIAECVLNRLGQGRFRAYSAGSHPKGEVHPYAIQLLKKQNFPTAELRSKSWDEFAAEGAPRLDFVFTVCDNAANEPCPVWPGQPMTAHWGVPDPAAVEGTEAEKHLAFAEALRYLHNRISIFTSLPLRSLDKLSLQRRIDQIGRQIPVAAEGAA